MGGEEGGDERISICISIKRAENMSEGSFFFFFFFFFLTHVISHAA